jgi:hypothetical protein
MAIHTRIIDPVPHLNVCVLIEFPRPVPNRIKNLVARIAPLLEPRDHHHRRIT